MNKEPVTHPNGILNLNWFKEEAKTISPEKEKAILARNKALSQVPVSERKGWAEKHPLEMFMQETLTHNQEHNVARLDSQIRSAKQKAKEQNVKNLMQRETARNESERE